MLSKRTFCQIFQQKGYLQTLNLRKDVIIGTSTLLLSLILFYWHIHEDRFVLHIILYYAVNFVSVYAFIYLSKSLNSIKSRIITLISIGTMLIFGLHRIIIGIIDYGLEKYLNQTIITYDWYECLLLAIIIEFMFLLSIQYSQNHYPIIFGKKKHTKFG